MKNCDVLRGTMEKIRFLNLIQLQYVFIGRSLSDPHSMDHELPKAVLDLPLRHLDHVLWQDRVWEFLPKFASPPPKNRAKNTMNNSFKIYLHYQFKRTILQWYSKFAKSSFTFAIVLSTSNSSWISAHEFLDLCWRFFGLQYIMSSNVVDFFGTDAAYRVRSEDFRRLNQGVS